MTAKSRRARGAVLSAESSSQRRTADKGARTPDSARTEGQRLLLLVPGSLTDLTARLGAGRSTVSDWRRGAGLPGDDARARLHAAYGIPARAWDLKPQGATLPAAPAAPPAPYARLTPERWAQIEAEDAEIERELDELTRDISDDACRSHPLYQDLLTIIRDVLVAHRSAHAPVAVAHNALLNALNELEDDIEADGWRPWRRPTPTPAPAG